MGGEGGGADGSSRLRACESADGGPGAGKGPAGAVLLNEASVGPTSGDPVESEGSESDEEADDESSDVRLLVEVPGPAGPGSSCHV